MQEPEITYLGQQALPVEVLSPRFVLNRIWRLKQSLPWRLRPHVRREIKNYHLIPKGGWLKEIVKANLSSCFNLTIH